jgi:hypothetical protein
MAAPYYSIRNTVHNIFKFWFSKKGSPIELNGCIVVLQNAALQIFSPDEMVKVISLRKKMIKGTSKLAKETPF